MGAPNKQAKQEYRAVTTAKVDEINETTVRWGLLPDYVPDKTDPNSDAMVSLPALFLASNLLTVLRPMNRSESEERFSKEWSLKRSNQKSHFPLCMFIHLSYINNCRTHI